MKAKKNTLPVPRIEVRKSNSDFVCVEERIKNIHTSQTVSIFLITKNQVTKKAFAGAPKAVDMLWNDESALYSWVRTRMGADAEVPVIKL